MASIPRRRAAHDRSVLIEAIEGKATPASRSSACGRSCPGAAAGSGVSTADRRVIVLALAQFLVIVDETSVALLAPSVARDFGLGAQARQVLVTPFAVAFVCALPVTGLLLRRVDPRMVVAPAILVFGLTATTGALAPTLGYLVAARAAQGVAAAVAATCILASLHLVTRDDPRRVRGFAVFSLISGSGSIAALLIAAPLAAHSWRWCFWAIAVSAVICAFAWGVMVWRRVSRIPQNRRAAPTSVQYSAEMR